MFAEVSVAEKEALVKLYQSTNGSQWTTKWNISMPVATWYGIKLENDKVVSINLADNNLKGELPKEIASLVNLQELNLHKNYISGSIPSSIVALKELKILDISFNRLTGSIPVSNCI
jgi:Leucine-rich repeat (LRR) protein